MSGEGQSYESYTRRPGHTHGSVYDCSDPKQWQNWDEVVLRREKIARNNWYGPEAEGREYSMETRKWSATVNPRVQSAAEIVQLPAIGNAAFDRGDNDAALLAYSAAERAVTAQLGESGVDISESDPEEHPRSHTSTGLTTHEVCSPRALSLCSSSHALCHGRCRHPQLSCSRTIRELCVVFVLCPACFRS